MKKMIMTFALLSSLSALADDFRPMSCVEKVMKMNAQMKAGKAIPRNEFYRDIKVRAQAEFRSASLWDAKFESIYYINSNSNAVIAICDDETGYEQGDCLEYYFNKNDSKLNLLAIKKLSHIGKDKINFLCEGE